MENSKKELKYYAEPLAAIDALGRRTPDGATVPAPRKDRLVGMFYFLWLGEHGRHKPYDVSKITKEDPQAGYHPDSPLWGGVGCYHHWGEPFYGYYYSEDEWVIRHHMKLMIEADIDFLFFDTTNAVVYEENCKKVMRVLQEYHDAGWKIPRVMFYTNTASGKTVQKIYEAIYKPAYCPDTWFYYEGKPIIIAVPEECSPETRDFFNIKLSQWPNEADKLGGWPWMDFVRPQRVFANLQNKPEVINVSVAQHPQLRFGDSVLYGEQGNCGRAYHDGRNDPRPDAYLYGDNYREQFERAIEADPPVVLVTGWNEWIAGYWKGIPERPVMFVDCANYEYSRDLEMMRGGYFDNYFMQTVGFVRRYKGAEAGRLFHTGEEASYPCFADGDFPRACEGYGTYYENRTQRNVLTEIRVSHTKEEICFTMIGKAPITPFDGSGSWMRLYLVTEDGTGEHYVLNAHPNRADKTTLARVGESLDSLVDIADATYTVDGNRMEVRVARKSLGLDGDFTLWFKWADATAPIQSVEDFYETGDAAPLGRLYFVYRATDTVHGEKEG